MALSSQTPFSLTDEETSVCQVGLMNRKRKARKTMEKPGAFRQQHFDAGTVQISYAEGPQTGKPFVFLHGGAEGGRSGYAFLAMLSPHWHVYAPDLRGHGGSGRVAGQYRIQDYVPDISAFLQEVVQAPAVVMGHSLGANVGIMLAALHPHLVHALIVCDSPPFKHVAPPHASQLPKIVARCRELAASGQTAAQMVAALREIAAGYAHDVFGKHDDWLTLQAENLCHVDPAVVTCIEDVERMNQGYDAAVLLPAIRCPVLFLQADAAAGGLTTDEEIERALQLLPEGRRVFLKGVSHATYKDQPELVLQAISTFLSTLSA
jgi:pimeloyl-ACP methyl ester carboxylesterase